MATKIITAPSVEPVSLTEAKDHCRVDGAEFDALFNGVIIPAARESAEHELNRALCTQTRELVLDEFEDELFLFGDPIQSVVSIKYLDSYGVQQTLDPINYTLDKDSSPGCVKVSYGKVWPETYKEMNAVRVQYVCGYGNAAAVPSAIKAWILLAIGTLKAQTETIGDNKQASLPDRFWHRLLDPYRVYGESR